MRINEVRAKHWQRSETASFVKNFGPEIDRRCAGVTDEGRATEIVARLVEQAKTDGVDVRRNGEPMYVSATMAFRIDAGWIGKWVADENRKVRLYRAERMPYEQGGMQELVTVVRQMQLAASTGFPQYRDARDGAQAIAQCMREVLTERLALEAAGEAAYTQEMETVRRTYEEQGRNVTLQPWAELPDRQKEHYVRAALAGIEAAIETAFPEGTTA